VEPFVIARMLGLMIALALIGAQVALVVWLIHIKASWALVAWFALALSASNWAVDVAERLSAWARGGKGLGLVLRRVMLSTTLAALMSLLIVGAFGKWHPSWRGRR
jgi:hypothetical protein